MSPITPTSADEMAETLSRLATAGETIRLGGSFSKDGMGGPLAGSQVISTRALNRVLQYEPNDLTISVEAGMRWRDLETLLATNRQMIPLDPWHDESTVGGVIAANISGPRRRLFGTARDVVIGMKFATLEGKLVQSGGMVVKNVAGLDMGKLLIGSFGTLAAMTSVNFKLMPMPEQSRTFGFSHDSPSAAAKQTGELLRGQLQPVAIDIMKEHNGKCGLLIQAAGTAAVVRRYQREFGIDGHEGAMEQEVWGVRQNLSFQP